MYLFADGFSLFVCVFDTDREMDKQTEMRERWRWNGENGDMRIQNSIVHCCSIMCLCGCLIACMFLFDHIVG